MALVKNANNILDNLIKIFKFAKVKNVVNFRCYKLMELVQTVRHIPENKVMGNSVVPINVITHAILLYSMANASFVSIIQHQMLSKENVYLNSVINYQD